MGFMQRHTRGFFLGGIIVMVLSLGSFFFATQVGSTDPAANDQATATATATAESTAGADPDGTIVRFYAAPPEMTIDTTASYEAVIHLEGGDVRIKLFADEAPEYVNNFVFLAQNHFYDGLTFHRVIPGFVAQGGDPSGGGAGSPGYALTEELNSLKFLPGALSMAKDSAGRVNGSQFFVTLGLTPHLDGGFTVFGEVTEGLDILEGLTPRDPDEAPEAEGDTIIGIEIIEGGA